MGMSSERSNTTPRPATAAKEPTGGRTSRERFVGRVADECQRAGIDYAFLHGWLENGKDSDVDVVVSPDSLDALDTLVRTGRLGQLVQRLDYDVPFCRYYVVRVDEEGRRYRQLDVACDPWGISRYGAAARVALEHSVLTGGGLRVSVPAATCLYLSAKRAQKGVDEAEIRGLTETFEADPAGARALLLAHFGRAGRQLAEALAEGKHVERSLTSIRREVERLPPTLKCRQIAFRAYRLIRRLIAPTGLVVGVVGPDGAGKSALASALQTAALGPFRRVARLHLGPSLLPPPGRLLGRSPGPVDSPHARRPSGRLASFARISWLAADCALGWLPRVTNLKLRSGLVIVERGFHDLAVDPQRYRLGSGMPLVRALARVLPSPDVTLVIDAEGDRIRERKRELPLPEIERQLSAWRDLCDRKSERFLAVPSDTREAAIEGALQVIEDRLAGRQRDLTRFDLAVQCIGEPHAKGQPFSLVTAAGRARWILPRGPGSVGPIGAGLYRPASPRTAAGAALLEGVQRSGGVGLKQLRLDLSQGLAGEIAASMRLASVELAVGLHTDDERSRRALLAVRHRGSTIAYAKIAEADSHELQREVAVLAALEPCPFQSIEVPRVLDVFIWRGLQVALLSPMRGRGRPNRAVGVIEVEALIELAGIGERLTPLLGNPESRIPQHGDFCGWNSVRTRSGKLALWDWEWAHAGHPLEDWFHWHTQRFCAFGHGGADKLIAAAFRPNPLFDKLATGLGVSISERERGLVDSLRSYLSRLADDGPPQRQLVGEALEHLNGRTPT